MPWTRGEASVEVELSRTQSWIEATDPELYGQGGEPGMLREWHDFCAQRRAFESFVRWAFIVIGFLVGLPGVLVSLSAIGIIHLK